MVLYRYEDIWHSSWDEFNDRHISSTVQITLIEYKVVAETPKGYWITFNFKSKDKWVSKTSRKRYAHANKEEALWGLYYRRKHQEKIYENRLERIKETLKEIEHDFKNI